MPAQFDSSLDLDSLGGADEAKAWIKDQLWKMYARSQSKHMWLRIGWATIDFYKTLDPYKSWAASLSTALQFVSIV